MLPALLSEIANCRVCEAFLEAGCRPVLAAHSNSKILVIGQAPGRKVHESGIPWNDQSGKKLRHWMNVSSEEFYNTELFGIVPMGFCFPGTGKSGDLPPRKECAPLWHQRLLDLMPNVELTLLIGQYAQNAYLGKLGKANLTETVRAWEEYLPKFIPLPHPSPRNNIWQRKNPWFEQDLVPALEGIVHSILAE